MRHSILLVPLLAAAVPCPAAEPPARAEIQAQMGLASEGDLVRGQLDTVGFAVTRDQAEDVHRAALAAAAGFLAAQDARLGMTAEDGFVAAVVPHDDHLYAAEVAVRATERIAARRVILVGVFHRARDWDLADRLVFDSFEAWHGPWGPVRVDPLREELVAALPADAVVVSNAMHEREHSLEGLTPLLQARQRELTIVPVLVPYMGWERMSELAERLSAALAASIETHDWKLGADLAVVISSDAVHYGPDFDHAPFGTDAAAYRRAVDRDRMLAERFLAGALRADAARGLLETLVDPADGRTYRIPWCGRFSIPFGMELVRRTAERLGRRAPVGTVLATGTSLTGPQLAVSDATLAAGLGTTAPANLHHWVGYVAAGWR